MHFLTCHKNKVIIGWSAKCGCTHIKRIFKYLAHNQNIIDHNAIHHHTHSNLPRNIEGYTIIIIIRNPFKRLVSGFREKYNPAPGSSGTCYSMWNLDKILSFSNFVDELIKSNWKVIHKHHFIMQLSEAYEHRIETHDKLFIYDLENINYQKIEEVFQQKIPEELISFRGGHENTRTLTSTEPVQELFIGDYNDCNLPLHCFYNEDIEKKVREFFRKDFEFFQQYGFNYSIPN